MSLSEMLFLGLLGLVIFGPKKLAEAAQGAGKLVARWKNVSREFQSQLAAEISTTASDLKRERVPPEAGLVETSLMQIVKR
jgi:Sec-independent protein translocase protein TatA